jgi:type II secretory pathway predicted ATPase ExeA
VNGGFKRALVTLVDQRGVVPIIVLDDAQFLRDEVLHELHGLTSLDCDGRDYLTVWLVGHPRLDRRLRLQQQDVASPRALVKFPSSMIDATGGSLNLQGSPGGPAALTGQPAALTGRHSVMR